MATLWKKLLSSSAAPLMLTTQNLGRIIFYEKLHFTNQRATPKLILIYKHVLLLKSILSKKYPPLRESIEMSTSSDPQQLSCQNTFYRQFISGYNLILDNNRSPDPPRP